MNQYPVWKYLLIVVVLLIGGLYALPNIFGDDPAVQISARVGSVVDSSAEEMVKNGLLGAGIEYKEVAIDGEQMVVRFRNTEDQLMAYPVIRESLGRGFSVAQNIVPATPAWLRGFNPMYLGLDLRGGVHLLLEVDMNAAVTKAEDRYVEDIRSQLRDKRVRYLSVKRQDDGGIEVRFRNQAEYDAALDVIEREFPALITKEQLIDGKIFLQASLSDQEIREVKSFAIQQNLTTLRNRVNELGVAEPNISRQGEDRIVVQLPGVQDSTRMRELLSATATLEFRVVDTNRNANEAKQTGRPGIAEKESYPHR